MRLDNGSITKVEINSQTGSLLFETPGISGTRHRLNSWGNNLTLCEKRRGTFEEVNKDLYFHLGLEKQQNIDTNDPITIFTATIPEEIRTLVAPFSYAQLQALQVFRKGGPPALELANSAPILIWIIACAVLANRISTEQAVYLCKDKRINIIRVIHPESSTAHVKAVSRIMPVNYCKSELRILHQLLKDKDLRTNLQHLSRIILPKIEVIIDSPDIQNIPIIKQELSNPDTSIYRIQVAKSMCKTCLCFGRVAGLGNTNHTLANCESLEELISLTNRWHNHYNKKMNEQLAAYRREKEAQEELDLAIRAEKERQNQLRQERRRIRQARNRELNKLKDEKRQNARRNGFHSPPIPGNKFIVPITTYKELQHEGEIMNHCVKDYEDAILFGSSYIYKVFYIERCTVEVICKNNCLIGELRAKNNKKPLKKVRQYLQQWIDHNAK